MLFKKFGYNYSIHHLLLFFSFLSLQFACTNKEQKVIQHKLFTESLLDSSNYVQDQTLKIDLINQVIEVSQKNGWEELSLNAQFHLLNLAYQIGDINYIFKHGFEIAVKAEDLKNYEIEIGALRYLGHAYVRMGFINEAQKNFLDAINLTKKLKNQDEKHFLTGLTLISYASNIEDPTEEKTAKNKAIKHLLQVSENHSNYIVAHSVGLNLKANLFFAETQMDSAEFYFKKAISVFSSDSVNNDALTYPLETLGILYHETHQYRNAIIYYRKALKISENLNKKYGIADLSIRLYDAYNKLNNSDSSQYFLYKYTYLKDSLSKVEKSAAPKSIEKLLIQNGKELQEFNNWKTSIFLFFFLVLASLYITFVKYKKSKNNIKNLDNRLQKKLKVIQKMSQEIETKSKFDTSHLISMVKNSDDGFSISFHELFPNFEPTLMKKAAPNKLVSSEIEVCALMKLDFDTKEIAKFTNSSVRAIESKKYRIRKKLDIEGNENLNTWMSKI